MMLVVWFMMMMFESKKAQIFLIVFLSFSGIIVMSLIIPDVNDKPAGEIWREERAEERRLWFEENPPVPWKDSETKRVEGLIAERNLASQQYWLEREKAEDEAMREKVESEMTEADKREAER